MTKSFESVIPESELKHFKLGHPTHRESAIVHDSLELLPLRGAREFPNVETDSPIAGHYAYDIRTIGGYFRKKHRIILPKDKIIGASNVISHLNALGVPEIPSLEDIIPLEKNGHPQISQTLIEQNNTLRSQFDGIKRLRFYMHSEMIDRVLKALDLETERKSYVPTLIADNNCITHTIFENRFAETDKPYFIPEGQIVYTLEEAIEVFEELKKRYAEIIVRLPHGSAGQGLTLCNSIEELKTVLNDPVVKTYLITNNPSGTKVEELIKCVSEGQEINPEQLEKYLDQPLGLKIEGFIAERPEHKHLNLGAVLWIDNKSNQPQHYMSGMSEQGLSRQMVHESNLYYPEIWHPEIEDFLNNCADFLYQIGAYGPNGIDFLVDLNPRGQVEKIVFMEINPRDTGQSHLNRLTEKLTSTAFPKDRVYKGTNIKDPRNFKTLEQDLKRKGVLYNPDRVEGTLILNVIESAHKSMIYTIAENINQLTEIEKQIRKL